MYPFKYSFPHPPNVPIDSSNIPLFYTSRGQLTVIFRLINSNYIRNCRSVDGKKNIILDLTGGIINTENPNHIL